MTLFNYSYSNAFFLLWLLTLPCGVLRYNVTDHKDTQVKGSFLAVQGLEHFLCTCLRIWTLDECRLFKLLLHWACTDACIKPIETFSTWLIRTLHKFQWKPFPMALTWQFFQRMSSSNKYKCIKLKLGEKWKMTAQLWNVSINLNLKISWMKRGENGKD